jgi:predicted DNA-binding transcriptional regulator AlpA
MDIASKADPTMEPTKILRKREVLRRTDYLDYSSIWRLERNGQFPKRILLNANGAVGWIEAEVDEWIRSRVRAGGRAVRRAKPAPAPARRQRVHLYD